mgnify:CR=1 FL=1
MNYAILSNTSKELKRSALSTQIRNDIKAAKKDNRDTAHWLKKRFGNMSFKEVSA